METKTAEFIQLLDQALDIAEQTKNYPQVQQSESGHSQRLNNVISNLQSIKSQILSGNLEPSGGRLTLGLAREVADWLDPLHSPLLKVLGAVEEYYQNNF